MDYYINELVRLEKYDKGSPDSHARIDAVKPDGSVFLVNLNMPFCGSFCQWVSKAEFEKLMPRREYTRR